ncbi:dTDP-4-dehydrorhamnose reductase [Ideonella sp. YS5]|uniref:dTDP-4-dehydrorhamnose reductase n=1 Tax=Ideonella sp. YS5 TaxID=3453714 RepID=UPI003EEE2F81
MKILLLGPNGQVGWELQRSLQPLGEVLALDRHEGADLSQPAALAATVRALAPDVIVNAAAYTAVDRAEGEVEMARAVNAAGPAVLAREAAALGAWLVHYSTDYVFDGSGDEPRDEQASTGPLSVYGQTKLEGEQAMAASGCKHLIFRTSWIYATRGGNFAKTMLRLASERDELKVVCDQVGAPTSAELVADVTAHALRRALGNPAVAGLYHLCAAGHTTWFDYARHVIERGRAAGLPLRVQPQSIVPVPSSAYPTAARRPLNSRLRCDKLRQCFDLHLPPWQTGVERMLAEIR